MEVDGITVARALEIENASVTSGYIAPGSGHLILVTAGGEEIDAGEVRIVVPTGLTFDLTDNTLIGTKAEFNAALSDGDFATLAGAETLTNKGIDLTDNTLNGTTAEFNAANSDHDFATLDGAETLSNKTLDSPVISGVGKKTTLVKVADQAKVSTTVLADDTHLVFAVPGAGTYLFDFYIYASSTADNAGDLRIGFAFPAGTLIVGIDGLDATLASGQSGTVNKTAGGFATGATVALVGLSSNYTATRVHGILTATAAGDFKLQWAQANSDTHQSVIKAGSHYIIERVA